MRKVLLVSILLFAGILMQAQIKGIDLSKAIETTDSTKIEDVYNQLVTHDSMYAIPYRTNTVGVVYSHRKILSILEANELDFDKPDYDNSYLSSYVDGYDDYENIPHSVKVGKSIIMMEWIVNEYILGWSLSEDGFYIRINPIKE